MADKDFEKRRTAVRFGCRVDAMAADWYRTHAQTASRDDGSLHPTRANVVDTHRAGKNQF